MSSSETAATASRKRVRIDSTTPPDRPEQRPSASTTTSKEREKPTEDPLRERKRTLDRLSQRATRDRTRNKIAYLEGLVRKFETQSENETIRELMKEVETLRAEKEGLLKTLNQIGGLIAYAVPAAGGSCNKRADDKLDGCGSSGEKQSPERDADFNKEEEINVDDFLNSIPKPTSNGVEIFTVAATSVSPQSNESYSPPTEIINTNLHITNGISTTICGESVLDPIFDPDGYISQNTMLSFTNDSTDVGFTAINNDYSTHVQQARQKRLDDYAMPLYRMLPPRYENKLPVAPWWQFANLTLSRGLEASKKLRSIQSHRLNLIQNSYPSSCPARLPTLDDTVPLRALISPQGWDDDEVKRILATGDQPAWAVLRRIDKGIFGNCGKVERLAIMYMMSRTFMYHLEPTAENLEKIPHWLRRQGTTEHQIAVNYFVWPNIRNRFAHPHSNYASNVSAFSSHFPAYLRISYPHPFSSCYTVLPPTFSTLPHPQYQISEMFQTAIHKLENWTMTSEFFDHFPELQNDIPILKNPDRRVVDIAREQDLGLERLRDEDGIVDREGRESREWLASLHSGHPLIKSLGTFYGLDGLSV